MADVTEQTPLAATPERRPKSLKRLVVTSAAISLALGFAAVSAVDHGLMSFSSSLPYVQIKLDDTSFCLGVLDRKNADSKSKLIIYECDSKMKGQAFQMKSVGGGYNILYNTYKGGNEDVDRTLCVNNPSSGGTLQLYQCKSGDPNSLWYYKDGKLMSKKDEMCMATEVPYGQSSLSNSDYVQAMWCGEEYTKWDVPTRPTPRPTRSPTRSPTRRPTQRPTPRPTPRPVSSPGACNHFCEGDYDCWVGGYNPCQVCYQNECRESKPSSGGQCDDPCYEDSDCKTSCSKCLDYGDGVRKTCQKPQSGQCNKPCYSDRDCGFVGGSNPCSACMPYGDGVRQWCQEYCSRDSDCDSRFARCGRDNYCVPK